MLESSLFNKYIPTLVNVSGATGVAYDPIHFQSSSGKVHLAHAQIQISCIHGAGGVDVLLSFSPGPGAFMLKLQQTDI